MRIPCGKNDHWSRIDLFVFWPEGGFDQDVFAAEMGLPSHDRPWLAQAADDPRCHTHGSLVYVEPDEDERHAGDAGSEPEAEHSAWLLRLVSYRFPRHHEDVSYFDLKTVFAAMSKAAQTEECFVAAKVDLTFPAEAAEWRPALLARPPELADLKEDLGRIVLSGVTLRFEESSQGLVEAHLEVTSGGESYTTSLQFSEVVPKESLERMYELVLNKAEGFASLFVNFHQGTGVAG